MNGIRPLTPDDINAGLRLSRLSNWNQLEEDWRYFVEPPGIGGRVYERDGVVVGSVAYLRYGDCFSWLSMMLVDPAERRTGIGSQLMEAALEDLSGEACVRLDATPAGEPMYRKFGFVPEYGLTRAKAKVAGFTQSSHVRQLATEDFAQVFARDKAVFGADRSALLISLHRRAPEFAWISHDGSSYCFGRPGYLYSQVGPIVGEFGRDLLGSSLSRLVGTTIAIDVPQAAQEWVRWLESVGFVMERPFLRMRRGENACPGVTERQFAIAGPELG